VDTKSACRIMWFSDSVLFLYHHRRPRPCIFLFVPCHELSGVRSKVDVYDHSAWQRAWIDDNELQICNCNLKKSDHQLSVE
jgi:hypothetical protein